MKLIFTLSAGRTGTAFLAELLARNIDITKAEVHHERVGYDAFGVDTPDLSDTVTFNSRGNVAKVRRFWDQKLNRILEGGVEVYAETSHVLMKAGLVENAMRLCQDHQLHFVRLRRQMVPTLLSYHRRGGFLNKATQWVWYLDHDYPRTLLKPEKFVALGLHGIALWYLMEVEFRAAYYMTRYGDEPNVQFHEVDLEELNRPERASELLGEILGDHRVDHVEVPGRINATEAAEPPDPNSVGVLEKLVTAASEQLDPLATAREYIREGVDPFAPEE